MTNIVVLDLFFENLRVKKKFEMKLRNFEKRDVVIHIFSILKLKISVSVFINFSVNEIFPTKNRLGYMY